LLADAQQIRPLIGGEERHAHCANCLPYKKVLFSYEREATAMTCRHAFQPEHMGIIIYFFTTINARKQLCISSPSKAIIIIIYFKIYIEKQYI